jgi:hypothetical protein
MRRTEKVIRGRDRGCNTIEEGLVGREVGGCGTAGRWGMMGDFLFVARTSAYIGMGIFGLFHIFNFLILGFTNDTVFQGGKIFD